ncbi:monothiol glutaredoxin grx5 [Cryptotrichosporon argae]
MSFARSLQVLRALPPRQVARTASLIQRRYLSDQARKLIDDAVTANPLVVFMKGTPEQPQCGFSRAVCQILDVQGVPREKLKSFNCLEDQALREGIKEYSDWPTIPQVYVKGEFVGGCDIVLSMHQSGELEKLLVKEGLVPELPPLEEDK